MKSWCRMKLCFSVLFSLAFSQFAGAEVEVLDVAGHRVGSRVQGNTITLEEYRRGRPLRLRVDKAQTQFTLGAPDKALSLSLGGREYLVRPLPQDFPRYAFTGRSSLQLPIVFSVSKHNDSAVTCHLFVLSGAGELEFYRRLPFPCVDFRPHSVNGKQYYSYHHTKTGVAGLGFVGVRSILDSEFRLLETHAAELDHHEFVLYDLRHWVGIEVKLGRLKSGMSFYDKRVREWHNGKLVFDWGVADFMRQFETEAAALIRMTEWNNELIADILHINAVQRLGDDGYLIGLGTNGVVYVDRASGKVKWVLGGLNDQFGLTHAQHPHFFHTPHFDPRRQELVLFSNGRLFDGVTQVLRYKIDPEKKQLERFEVLRNENELSTLLGSVQLLEGTLNVSFGIRIRGKHDFVELRNGKQLASLTFLTPDAIAYRIYRAPMGQ